SADSATATTNETAKPDGPQVDAGIAQQPVDETPAAHDDFDWSIDKRNVASYNAEEKEKYHQVYDNTFVQINDGELIKGTIVGITNTDVVLNIGFKSAVLVSLKE